MSVKGLKIIKCTKCGKTTLLDEYELNGCACGSHEHGVDYQTYKNRAHLAALDGIQVFKGIYHKTGYLHYDHEKRYALITNVTCGTPETFMNHAYVQNVTKNSMKLLKSISPGTPIQFKANVKRYFNGSARYGLTHMHHVTVLQ